MSVLAALLLFAGQPEPAQSIDGRWINPSKSVIIQIGPCGEARCGKVEWASEAAQADARKNAPNLIGTALLTELEPETATQWKGKLFVPDRDIHAEAKIALDGPEMIKVSGCALGGIICDTQVWSRAPATP